MLKIGLLLLLSLFIRIMHGFPPRILTGVGVSTKSHKDILISATRKAIGQFLKDNKYLDVNAKTDDLYEIVDTFFGSDKDGKEKYMSSVDDIFSQLEKEETLQEAYVHCNAEQFLEAHNRILSFRSIIKQLAAEPIPDILLIRQYIGKCLYTIQAFYSTSNWIEMGKSTTYRDFGVPGKTLMPVAAQDVNTCMNCDNSGTDVNSCKNNLLVTNVLTSGYHSGQNVPTPERDTASITGKCGFGGSSDKDNGKSTAIGGINKDRKYSSYSPHYHLHVAAYSAAVEASVQFLVDPDIGLINELKKNIFANVFNLNKRNKGSFGFAIDVTGSMGDDIENVKKECTEIVTNVRGTANEPYDYVLTTFSDPEYLTTHVLTTRDGLLMTNTIQNLVVDGGGDCPEYCMSGLLKCIHEVREKSTIFVFTDASAKDKSNWDTVVTAANTKDITMQFLVTGYEFSCYRKKRSLERFIRQTETSVYDSIALATGGKVYRITANQISTAMKEIVEESFPSATAMIDIFTQSVTDSNFMTFFIDTSVDSIKIKIVGPYGSNEVDVLNNSVSVLSSSNTTVLFESPDKVFISLVAPLPGEYVISRTAARVWEVNITGQTSIDFNYYILEEYDNEYWYRTSDNPIRGGNYTVEIEVYNLSSNGSIQELLLIDNNGQHSSFMVTSGSSIYSTTTMFAPVSFVSKFYRVGIRGYDEDGNKFQRMAEHLIYPVDVKLVIASPTELIVDALTSVPYSVNNMGSLSDTYLVTVVNNRGFSSFNTTATFTILAGESVSSEFQIQGSSVYSTVTYTINIKSMTSGDVIQQQSRTVFVSTNKPPECTVTGTTSNCSLDHNNDTCSSVQWHGYASVVFSSGITSVTTTYGLHLETADFATSPMSVSVRSDCCTTYGYITVIDKNNNMERCYFNPREDKVVPETKSALSTTESIAIGVVAGIVVACIMVVIVIVVIVYRKGIKPKLDEMKIKDLSTRSSRGLPVQSDMSSTSHMSGNFSSLNYWSQSAPPRDTKMLISVTELE